MELTKRQQNNNNNNNKKQVNEHVNNIRDNGRTEDLGKTNHPRHWRDPHRICKKSMSIYLYIDKNEKVKECKKNQKKNRTVTECFALDFLCIGCVCV